MLVEMIGRVAEPTVYLYLLWQMVISSVTCQVKQRGSVS